MSASMRAAEWITTHPLVIVTIVLLISVVAVGGVAQLDTGSSLGEFEGESTERAALAYVAENFTEYDGPDQSVVLIAVTGEDVDVLSRESMIEGLALQTEIRDDEQVATSLDESTPTIGLENIVATALIREDEIEALRTRATVLEERENELRERNATLSTGLEDIVDLQQRYDSLNNSYKDGEIEDNEYQQRALEIEEDIDDVIERVTRELDEDSTVRYARAVKTVRATQHELNTLDPDSFASDAEYQRVRDRLNADLSAAVADGTVGILAAEFDSLRAEYETIQSDRRAIEEAPEPSLDEQMAALKGVDDTAFEDTLTRLLENETEPFAALSAHFLPADRNGSVTDVDSRLIVVSHERSASPDQADIDTVSDDDVQTQRGIADLVTRHAENDEQDYVVFGAGLVLEELDRSIKDNIVIVGFLALGIVSTILGTILRDPVEVVISGIGAGVVLLWTLGVMGWLGIAFNQALVAVPILLLGLSIDFALHPLLRHREHIATGDRQHEPDHSVSTALARTGPVLALVSLAMVIGFLANFVSPVESIRSFGLVGAIGILSAFLVFGAFVPALTVIARTAGMIPSNPPTRRGFRGSSVGRNVISTVIHRPRVILLCTILITAASMGAAVTIDTEVDEEDFLADEPPAWATVLPEAVTPDSPAAKKAMIDITEQFHYPDQRGQVLVRGDLTEPEVVARLATVHDQATEIEEIGRDVDGSPTITSPLSLMQRVANNDASFAARYELADRSGDGVPDQNIGGLYEGIFEWAPAEARTVIHRTNSGEVVAIRLIIEGEHDADSEDVAVAVDQLAETIGNDDPTAPAVSVVPTGEPIIAHQLERSTFHAMIESFLLTLLAVLLLLAIVYRLTARQSALGLITLVPVVLTVCWIVGTMAVLDIPLNVFTAMIASLTVGLGIAFSIHVGARFLLERGRTDSVEQAVTVTMRETGHVLFGSAATTIGGMAALGVATLPVLRQFGVITAIMIAYAFLASVVVLPALLIVWSRVSGNVSRASDRAGVPAEIERDHRRENP